MNTPDLSKLSKEQKLQLYDLIEEQERRLRAQKTLYAPNDGQKRVHKSNAKLRVVTAGNGSGKSALLTHEVFWTAQGYNPERQEWIPVPNKSIVLLDSPDKVANYYIPEIAKWFNVEEMQLLKHGKPYITEIVLKNGSCIQFYFQQQELLVFESIQVDGIIAIDEPCPRWQYVALRRGARIKNRSAKILICGTPIAQPWLRKDIVEPWSKGELPDTECFKFGTAVNEKNLSSGYIEEFSRILTEQEKRIRLDGEFFDLSGLALAHIYDPIIHLVEPFEIPEEWPTVISIDPHPSKAHVATALTCDENGFLYYIGELKLKLPARRFAKELHAFMEPWRVIDIVVDSLGSGDGTGGEGFKSFIQVLNEEGIRARATTWDEKQDEAFMARIQDALLIPDAPDIDGNHFPKLRFFKGRSAGIVHDVENVQWQKIKNSEDHKPKLDISGTDFLACVKYGLATNLSPLKTKSKIYARKDNPYGVRKHREPPKVLRMRSQFKRFLNGHAKAKASSGWNDDD